MLSWRKYLLLMLITILKTLFQGPDQHPVHPLEAALGACPLQLMQLLWCSCDVVHLREWRSFIQKPPLVAQYMQLLLS